MVEKATPNNPKFIDRHFERSEKSIISLFAKISQSGKTILRNDDLLLTTPNRWGVN